MTFRAARGFRLAFPWALAALLVSCKPEKPQASPILEVEYKGCWAFYLPDQVCSLFPGSDHWLILWVRTTPPDLKVEIQAGGQLLPAASEELTSGRLYKKVKIPEHAGLLTVSVSSPDGRPGPSWSLRLAEPEKPAWTDEIKKLSPADTRARLEELREFGSSQGAGLHLEAARRFCSARWEARRG